METLRLSVAGGEGGTGAEALFSPRCGGRVWQITLSPGSDSPAIPILVPEAAGAVSGRNRAPCDTAWYNGCILLPFNDRIPNGVYRWNGTSHQLPINDPASGCAIHGLLYRCEMEQISLDEDPRESVAILGYHMSRDAFPGYPFELSIRLTYRLRLESFRLEIEVTNQGNQAAPVAIGWHPYFSLPDSGGRRPAVDSLHLRVPSRGYVEVDRYLMPSGRILPVEGSPYNFTVPRPPGNQPLDIAVQKGGEAVTLASDAYRLEVKSSKTFAYWQLFIPEDRMSVAIEPVSAATNSFNMPQLGLRTLFPEEKMQGIITLSLIGAGA